MNIKRPEKDLYEKSVLFSQPHNMLEERTIENFLDKITYHKSTSTNKRKYEETKQIMEYINKDGIINTKEIKSFDLINSPQEIPKDIFNIVCDKLIENISDKNALSFTNFRDNLYDILTYNIDISECMWYILSHFIKTGDLNRETAHDIIAKSHMFLKYYNNNYRPIYHLESIMFYIINKIHKYE
jgi:predicted transcriptional regulator YheO